MSSSPTSAPQPLFPGSTLSCLAVATLNCRGSLTKRLEEVSPTARSALRSATVVCLQECRHGGTILPGDQEALAALLGLTLLPDFHALLTKDTGIIVRIPDSHVVSYAYDTSRFKWAYMQLRLPAARTQAPILSIFSIHGPFSHADWQPIATALRKHHPSPDRACIIGADWNSVPEPLLDSFNARPTGVPWSTPAAAIAHLCLSDTYRHLYPTAPDYTHYVVSRQGAARIPTLISAKRLDSILCSPTLTPFLTAAATYQTSSDHKAVLATFATHQSATLPSPLPPASWDDTWALHPGLWLSPDFVSAVRRLAASYVATHSLRRLTARAAWSLFHDEMRTRLRALSVSHGATQRQLMRNVSHAATALDRLDWRQPAAIQDLPGLLYTYRSALAALEAAVSLPFHSRLAASEMRHSSWLASTSAPSKRSPLPVLHFQGHTLDTPDAKLYGIWSFYSSLYTPPSIDPSFGPTCARLLHHLQQRIKPSDLPTLSAPFADDEIRQALTTANRRSSPGPDGLPYRVWIELADVATPLLTGLMNELATGATLSVTARSILLPKKGDLSNLANYRPISISDAYVRTVARVVAARLLHVGDSILPWQQAAFLPGRRTTMIAGLLQGLTDHCSAGSPIAPKAFFVVSMDQQKAYDRVRTEWLFVCLAALGLPPSIINVLRALYHDPATRFHTAEGITLVVRFLCGVLQGDPSSCVIYNLTLQPFLDTLRSLGIGILVPVLGLLTYLAFADDYLLFFEASLKGVRDWIQMLAVLRDYEHVSNARVNASKSTFWLVGTPVGQDAPHATHLRNMILAFGLQAMDTDTPHAHLGHPISSVPEPTFPSITARCQAVRTRSLCFPTQGVSFLARVRRTKQFLTSRLWHSVSVGPLPADFAKMYFEAIQPYIFAHTRPYVGRSHLTTAPHLGGFGLLDPDDMATSLSLSFLRRYLTDPTPLGAWIRAGLTTELRIRYELPPAALLLRHTKTISVLQLPAVRGTGFFGRLLHALAHVDLGLSPDWIHLPWRSLITLPWTHATTTISLPDSSHTRYHRGGWITWGDLLWVRPCPSPQSPVTTALGPPPSKSVHQQGAHLPYAARQQSGVPNFDWPTLWTTLPAQVRESFLQLHLDTVDPLDVTSQSPVAPRGSWSPIPQDPGYQLFPWHLLTVGDTPLRALTTAQARRHLRSQTPYVPAWPLPPGTDATSFFRKVWLEVADSPIDEDMRSLVLLGLGRNLWTYRVDAAPCPAGCSDPDSPTHGLTTCPQAVRVWTSCIPVLLALGCSTPPSFLPHDIVGAWPAVSTHRPRLILWRNAVLVTLLRLRTNAAAASRKTNQPPNFYHCDVADVTSLTATAIFASLSATWAHVLRSSRPQLRSAFSKTWVDGCPLLHLDGDVLRACAVDPDLRS